MHENDRQCPSILQSYRTQLKLPTGQPRLSPDLRASSPSQLPPRRPLYRGLPRPPWPPPLPRSIHPSPRESPRQFTHLRHPDDVDDWVSEEVDVEQDDDDAVDDVRRLFVQPGPEVEDPESDHWERQSASAELTSRNKLLLAAIYVGHIT